jgi:MFS family permease
MNTKTIKKMGNEATLYRRNVAKMYAYQFFFNMYFISAVIVPFFVGWGGLKFSQIFYINAWFHFWSFLLEIPTGTVADFFGRRISLIYAPIVCIAGAIVYTSYPHIAIFLIGEVIWAVSYTLASGSDVALIYDSLKESGETKRSKAVISRLESFKLAGIVVGALLGAVFAKLINARVAFLLMVIPFSISLIIALSLKEPPTTDSPVENKEPYLKILSSGVRYFAGHRILKILTLDMVVVNALSFMIIWFYQQLLIRSGVDIVYFGVVHSAMAVGQILIISNFGVLERILGRKKRLLFFSAIAAGCLFILLGLTTLAAVVIPAIILAAGFGLSRGPLFTSYMNKFIPSNKRATILSTTSMFRTFSIVIANLTAGTLAGWSVSNSLMILGTVIIIFSFFSKIREEDLID